MLKKFEEDYLTIILPTLNEATNLDKLIPEINLLIKPIEIIVSDDNSIDNTLQTIEKLLKKYTNIKLIINNPPIGLRASIQKAIDTASGNLICWMDADFSHPPKLIKKMLTVIKTADIVVASRYFKTGSDSRKEIFAKFGSFIINRLCKFLFNHDLTDFTSGFIITRKKLLPKLKLKEDYGEYCIDFLVRASAFKYIIKEIPYKSVTRSYGKTKTNPNFITYIKHGLNYLKLIGSLYFRTKMNSLFSDRNN